MNTITISIPLSETTISQNIQTEQIGRTLHLVEETESTNSLAQHFAHNGTPHGTVVLAERQTKGKGRLGRQWHSPSAKNIYCSLVLQTLPPSSRVPWIPLVTGIALGNALHSFFQGRLALKWPNDLLIGDQKIGGILCENTHITEGGRAIIVGFGININMRRNEFPEELQDTSTSLLIETGKSFNRNQLIADILFQLERELSGLHKSPCFNNSRLVSKMVLDDWTKNSSPFILRSRS